MIFSLLLSILLQAGPVSSFDIGYFGRDWNDVAAYHLQSDGDVQ